MGVRPTAVIFDVGNVLYRWEPRALYERLIDDDQALDAFLENVCTKEWHFQHDAGRDFADTSAELTQQYPQHAELIAAWGPRFNEQLPGPVPGMPQIVADLHAAKVPIFGITNFSHEFWPPFRGREEAVFAPFRDIVVSGEERMVKPDPAIYALALDRFGLEGPDAVFVDDSPPNVDAARDAGIHAVLFTGAEDFRAELERLGLL
ncbi:HAD family hydrolase [Stakelama tenebrarum]|uniref:HAD family phosphatase n=1 Tax=Stakelama tenebrarum TaxID=2711215 RepID=A0A6G6YAQ6_9SPHN|nr:HAD family phosphatase [Sphingosinithalassobacter tenebrarum]QIG82015.1 HAD family phosphatase [Sphingosinithalassobacter tenebrarum]